MLGLTAGLQGLPALGAVLGLGPGWPGNPRHSTSVVPQFETCGRDIHPEFIFSLAMTFTNFLRVFFVVCCFLNSLPGLFTISLTRMTDLLSRRSFVLLLSIYAVS